MPINFFFIFGLLVIVAGISFYAFFRIGRISPKFKGKYTLHLVSLSFIGVGALLTAIGAFQMFF